LEKEDSPFENLSGAREAGGKENFLCLSEASLKNSPEADQAKRPEIFFGAYSLVTFLDGKKVTGAWGGAPNESGFPPARE
jgi:hypothetical protein